MEKHAEWYHLADEHILKDYKSADCHCPGNRLGVLFPSRTERVGVLS